MAHKKGESPAPKDGRPRGLTKEMAKAKRGLSLAVREAIPVEIFVRWHITIASGSAALVVEYDDGTLGVEAEKSGIAPTLEQRIRSMNWLADRGHGQAVQSIALEGYIESRHTNISAKVDLSALTPAKMLQLRKLLAPSASKELASGADAVDVADAEIVSTTVKPDDESED